MDAHELKETAMQTGSRILLRHNIKDVQKLSELFTNLLGDDPSLRKDLVMQTDINIENE